MFKIRGFKTPYFNRRVDTMLVDINKLSKLNNLLHDDLMNFENYIYDLLSIVKNMSFYWHDGYTVSFFGKINNVQNDVADLINSLYSLLNCLMSVYSHYNNINELKGDIGLWGIVNSDNFSINEMDDENMAIKKNILNNKVMYAEDDISFNLNKVKDIVVQAIEFKNLEINNDSSDFVGMDDIMSTEIERFNEKLLFFNSYSTKLISDMYSLPKIYQSVNSNKFMSKVELINDSFNMIEKNFFNAYEYINERIKGAVQSIDDIIDDIRGRFNK